MNSTLPASALEFVLGRNDTFFSSARDWQPQAIATHQQSQPPTNLALRLAMAARLQALLGRPIDPDMIWADVGDGVAVAVVNGVRFQLKHSQLVLFRPCVECGADQFASAALRTPADLGYALSAWEPRHRGCQPEDAADYLDYM